MSTRKALAIASAATLAAGGALAGTALATGGGAKATTVNVTLKEFAFSGLKAPKGQAATGIAPGRVTFNLRNTGQLPHNLNVYLMQQNGALRRVGGSADIANGTSGKTTLNLKPGSYLAVCTIFNGYHMSQGMFTRFTVGTQGIDFTTGVWK